MKSTKTPSSGFRGHPSSDPGKLLQKYIWLFLSAVLLCVLLFFYLQSSKRPLSLPVISESEWNRLISDKTPDERLLDSAPLLCSGVPVPRDLASGTYYLSQNLNSTRWQGALSVTGKACSLYFLEDEMLNDRSGAIASGHSFTLLALDRKNNRYQTASLLVSGLTVISITTGSSMEPGYPEEDVDNYYYNNETRYFGTIDILNTSPDSDSFGVFSSDLCYHERGATSAIYEKKNYALKLLDKTEKKNSRQLFGLGESAEWKLISMFTDRSKIRDMVSLKLWKELADREKDFSQYGADMAYCEVITDGNYMGLYGIIYPIDEQTQKLGSKDILYKVIASEPPSESAFQYSLDNNYNVAYPIRLRYPKEYDNITPYWEPMKNYLNYGYWHPDANLFSSLLDLRNVADFYIFNQVVSGADNQFKNTYMESRYRKDGGYYTTYIIPWDLNYTFGDDYIYDPKQLYTQFKPDTSVIYMESCLKQLFDENIAGAGDALRSRYSEARSSVLDTEHILELMNTNMDLLQNSGAFARDSRRWPESGNTDDLLELEQYVRDRMDFLDHYFLNN